MQYNTIIIGGGASGLMCAYQLQKASDNFLLLEKKESLGQKILLTGGKRCNVTNNLEVDDFIKSLTLSNKKFLYSSLNNFGTRDIVNFFSENRCKLKLEDNFKYFPFSNNSRDILNVFIDNIPPEKIILNSPVEKIIKQEDLFVVVCKDNQYIAKNIVIATGSKSFPHTGSSGDGLDFAKQFEIDTFEFTPAETHVYSKQVENQLSLLQGSSLSNVNVSIKDRNKNIKGDVLFTHFGLSGPAIMHLSEDIYDFLQNGKVVLQVSLVQVTKNQLDILFEKSKEEKFKIQSAIEKVCSKRITKVILEKYKVFNKNIMDIPEEIIREIKKELLSYEIEIDRVQDVTKAYVNKGGVSTLELNPKTMESTKVKNLYFIGETVNLHGPIGGSNLTIAFSSAVAASKNIIENSDKNK